MDLFRSMRSLSKILIVLFLQLFLQATTANNIVASSVRVSDSSVCLRDEDCGPGSFCAGPKPFALDESSRCTKGLPLNADCTKNACKQHLYCKTTKSSSPRQSFCKPRVALGGTCSAVDACISPLTCHPRNSNHGKCADPTSIGFSGSQCMVNNECQPSFYCKDNKACAPKVPIGAACGTKTGPCNGICAGQAFSPDRNGICLPYIPLGSTCRWKSDCSPENDRTDFNDKIICNKPRGNLGRCIRRKQVLTRLGAPCHSRHDNCNAERGLSCRWAPSLGRMACQYWNGRYCQPGRKLSRCKKGLVCEKRALTPGERFNFNNDKYFGCVFPAEYIPQGGYCTTFSSPCTPGTECRGVVGVLNVGGFRSPPAPFHYCVRVRKLGESCGNKFKTQCVDVDFSTCRNGVCVPGIGSGGFTHAAPFNACDKLPCAPGLTCDPADKKCDYIRPVVGRGAECNGSKRCAKGLECAVNWNGTGKLRCRSPGFGPGGFCTTEKMCRPGLKCPDVSASAYLFREKRCYDPKTILHKGDKCNPNAKLWEPQCDPGSEKEMTCLPGLDGGFRCQTLATLFQKCGDARNEYCLDTALTCAPYNICVPRWGYPRLLLRKTRI